LGLIEEPLGQHTRQKYKYSIDAPEQLIVLHELGVVPCDLNELNV